MKTTLRSLRARRLGVIKSLVCAAAVLSACGGELTSQLALHVDPIIGGTVDLADTAAVYMRATKGTSSGACSAVFIAPRVVLTAAHCVAADDFEYSVFIGDDFNDATQRAAPENTMRVLEHHPHPQFDANTDENDVGVLITELPFSRAPAVINRAPLDHSWVGHAVHLVGYGQRTAGDNSTIGTRMQTDNAVSTVDGSHFGMHGRPNICLFDSGGPTFATMDGGVVVTGIHVAVDTAACTGTGWDIRVDPFVDFLDPFLTRFQVPIDAGVTEADAGLSELPDAGPALTIPSVGIETRRAAGCATTGLEPASFVALGLTLVVIARRRARS